MKQRWSKGGIRVFSILMLLLTGACATRTVVASGAGPSPRLAEIDEGAPIRVRRIGGMWTEGRARGFAAGRPLVVSAGDTLVITCADDVQLRDPSERNHGVLGAIVGLGIGSVIVASGCGGQSYCGEENPTPILTAIAGWLIGRTDREVRYREIARHDCPARGGTEPAPHREE